ncbi:hypothetical protein [Cupriavidus sp. RAF12]
MMTVSTPAARQHTAPSHTSDEVRRTFAKVTLRIIPFLFVCYVFAYLDRVNIGFAALQMKQDLAFSDAV